LFFDVPLIEVAQHMSAEAKTAMLPIGNVLFVSF
jgi:hypothetical protein